MTISSKMNEKPEPRAEVGNACSRPRLVDAFRAASDISDRVSAVESWILCMHERGQFPTAADLEVLVLALGKLGSEMISLRLAMCELLERDNLRRESVRSAARDAERFIAIATSA